MKRLMVILLVGSLLSGGLMGCAETDRGQTQQEGAATGAAAGAVLGAVITALTGGDAGDALLGAAIGAAVGGVAGYAYGTHVADKKAEYAKQEEWLDACIASLDQTNKETKAYNAQLDTEITTLQKQTAQLKASYDKKKVQRQALLDEKTVVDKKLAEANEELNKAKWELANQEKVLVDAQNAGQADYAAKLDKRIATLKSEIAKLEKQTDELADMSSRMAV